MFFTKKQILNESIINKHVKDISFKPTNTTIDNISK